MTDITLTPGWKWILNCLAGGIISTLFFPFLICPHLNGKELAVMTIALWAGTTDWKEGEAWPAFLLYLVTSSLLALTIWLIYYRSQLHRFARHHVQMLIDYWIFSVLLILTVIWSGLGWKLACYLSDLPFLPTFTDLFFST